MANMENNIEIINATFERLIVRGANFLRYVRPVQSIPQNLIRDISKWIIESTDQIFPCIPRECSEWVLLCEIRRLYGSLVLTIPPNPAKDIIDVIANLKNAQQVLITILTTDCKEIPAKVQADIAYDRLKSTCDLVGQKLIPSLRDRENGRTIETGMLNTYGKIYCWVLSMIRLNEITDYLALSACVRAILELHIDMHLLDQNLIPNGVDRFFNFQIIKRHKVAKKSTRLREEKELTDPEEVSPLKEYLNSHPDKEEEIRDMTTEFWDTKPGRLLHWTDLSVIARIERIEDKELFSMYVDSYDYCNINIHSGYSDFMSKDRDIIFTYIAHLRYLASDMFTKATKLINVRVPVLEDSELESELDEINLTMTQKICKELVMAGRKKSNSE